VNLFVVGTAARPQAALQSAAEALARAADRLPGFEDRSVDKWANADATAVAVAISHAPDAVGGIRYRSFEPDRMALYAGRPFAWEESGAADGRGPLDPSFYLEPVERWRDRLDGRYAVARQLPGSDACEAFTDALGAYPLYAARGDGVSWVGNSPAVLADLAGGSELSTEVLTSFFACGWSLSGDPIWSRVRRIERGTRVTLRAGRIEERQDLFPAAELAATFSTRFDAGDAATAIAGAAAALADWPGRPAEVAITGGRDSRLALAGALRSGVAFTAMTKAFPGHEGYPDTADVTVARRLCRETGVEHRVICQEGGLNPLSDPRRAARILTATGPGTVSLGDSLELPAGGAPAPFPVLLGGQGAEVAKGAYGAAAANASPEALAELLLPKASPSFPPRLVDADGEQAVRSWLRAWAQRQIDSGVPVVEVPTLFHLLVRLGTWGGAGLTSRDFGLDTTSPMWTKRLLGQQVALPLAERRAGLFFARVLQELSPRLAEMPYEGGGKGLSAKVLKEARRRASRPLARFHGRAEADAFPGAFAEIREAVMTQPDHPAWSALQKRRVHRLLGRKPYALDPRSRQQVLRLGTVFLADAP
jgi:hypothetical protein